MPYDKLPMTQEELDQTVALFRTRDMSASFRDRDLSQVFPTAHELAAVWVDIPRSVLPHLQNAHAGFIAAIGPTQLARIARDSGGWPGFFDAFEIDKERCLQIMAGLGFRFDLPSQDVLGDLLVKFPYQSSWEPMGRLFTNIERIIEREKGLTGFLTDHFAGDAGLLFHSFRFTPHFYIEKDDAKVVFERIRGNVNLYRQFFMNLKGYLEDPESLQTLSDERLSGLLMQLSTPDLASMLGRQSLEYPFRGVPSDQALASRPNVLKDIAIKHGQSPVINSILLDKYLEKIGPAFWADHWQLLLPRMSSLESARQLLHRLGDSPETLAFLEQYQALVEKVAPMLEKIGVAKPLLDFLNNPWQRVHDISNDIDSGAMKYDDPCGCRSGFQAIGLLGLALLTLLLAMLGFVIKIPVDHLEIGKTYQKLIAILADLPRVDPSELVQTYRGLAPYHQSLLGQYPRTMFNNDLPQQPASSSTSGNGLAYAVYTAPGHAVLR